MVKGKTTKERSKRQQKKFDKENPKGYGGVRSYGAKRKFGGLYFSKSGNFLATKDAKKLKEAQKDTHFIRLVKVKKGYYDVFTRTKPKYKVKKKHLSKKKKK